MYGRMPADMVCPCCMPEDLFSSEGSFVLGECKHCAACQARHWGLLIDVINQTRIFYEQVCSALFADMGNSDPLAKWGNRK